MKPARIVEDLGQICREALRGFRRVTPIEKCRRCIAEIDVSVLRRDTSDALPERGSNRICQALRELIGQIFGFDPRLAEAVPATSPREGTP